MNKFFSFIGDVLMVAIAVILSIGSVLVLLAFFGLLLFSLYWLVISTV